MAKRAASPLPDNGICGLGKPTESFHYNGKSQSLTEWEGHGLALNPKDAMVTAEGCGTLHIQTETLVETTGGQGYKKGDTFVHNPRICFWGRQRADS